MSSLLRMHGELLRPRGGDPYWGSVVALLHFDGANNSTNFTDETGRSWSRGTGALISTAQSVFGGASGSFNGNNANAWVSSAASTDFDFGSGDFTVELWARNSTTPAGYRTLVSKDNVANASNRGWLMILDHTAGGVLSCSVRVGTTAYNVRSPSALILNTWYHIAFVRDGAVLRLYVNGGQVDSVAVDGSINAPSVACQVGNAQTGSDKLGAWNGYLDELRITKGVCRYPGGTTFMPSATPFPSS